MATKRTVQVRFRPQAWHDDYAIDVDPGGETLAYFPASKLHGIEPHTYEADHLRYEPEAPEWWENWTGPFEIEWDND